MSDGNREKVFVGESGTSYHVSSAGSCYDGSTLYVVDNIRDMAVIVPPRYLLNERCEAFLRSMCVFNSELFDSIGKQISCPVECVSLDGQFAGYVVTFMTAGVDLVSFLKMTALRKEARVRVASNLCALVQIACKFGIDLGGLNPMRVRIDPSNCRVFIASSFIYELEMNLVPNNFLGLPSRSSNHYELAVHVYSLLIGSRSTGLEMGVWPEGSLYAMPNDAGMPSRIARLLEEFNSLPRLVSRICRALEIRRANNIFRGVPASIAQILRNACFDKPCDIDALSFQLCNALNDANTARQSSLGYMIEKAGNAFRSGIPKESVRQNEMDYWGARSTGQENEFWKTTLIVSLVMGAFASINGFAPLDYLMVSHMPLQSRFQGSTINWQYLVAALLGCVLSNCFLANRKQFKGYAKTQYCLSVSVAIAFMTIPHVLSYFIRG